MADQNIGRLHVDITGDNSDLVKKLDESGQQLNKAAGNVADFSKNIGTLRQEYKHLSKLNLVGKTAEEIREVENRLASLRDEMGDYQARIDSLSKDPFQKAAEGVQALSTMMAGAAGAATLFGGSEEKLNQLMQKTIALIAIAEAAQTAADFSKQNAIGIFIKEKYAEIAARIREGLVIKTNTAATVAETGAKTGLSGVQKGLIVLQNAWNKAMLSSPIFIAIAAVAALVTGIVLLTKAYSDNAKEIEAVQKRQEDYNKAVKEGQELKIELLKRTGASSKAINEAELKASKDRNFSLREEIELIKKFQKNWDDAETGAKLRAKYGSVNEAYKKLPLLEAALDEEIELYKNLSKEQYLIESTSAIDLQKKRDEDNEKRLAAEKAINEKIIALQNQLFSAMQRENREVHKQAMLNIKSKDERIAAENEFNAKMINLQKALYQEEAEIYDEADQNAAKYGAKLNAQNQAISDAFNSSITTGLNDLIGGVAEAAGALAAGQGTFNNVFQAIGKTVANFCISLGKALIATGIAADAFKNSLKSHPYVAIAAGAALIAAGTIVSAKLSAGVGGGGGSTSFASSSSGGSTESANPYRTIFANGNNEMKIVGELRAEGSVLVASLYNENKRATN